MVMKDYLSTTERLNIIAALKVAEMTEQFVQGDLFTAKEKGDLKRSVSYLVKPIEKGVLPRLNKTAIKTFNKAIKQTQIFVSSKYEIDTYKKRVSSEIDVAYEDNKDYFKLVELILHYNCRNCTKTCSECEIYKEFEEKCIPEFTGTENTGKCKYSFKD